MTTFSYRGFERAGRSSRGLVEALHAKEAREKLAVRGVLCEELHAVASADAMRGGARSPGAESRASLYRELASLLLAGFTLEAALALLMEAPERSRLAALLASARDRIAEGGRFAEAWAAALPRVPLVEIAAMRAGERAGRLAGTLDELASVLEQQSVVRERLAAALTYPILVLVLALALVSGILLFVAPALERLFLESRMQLPVLTQGLLAAAHAAPIALPLLALSGVLAGWALRRRWTGQPAFREKCERWLDRVPVWGEGGQLLHAMRFARTMALLLRGGAPAVEALELAGEASGSQWIARMLREQADAVRHGTPLAAALRSVPGLGSLLGGWVQAGEASGDLAGMLGKAALGLERRWQAHLDRATKLAEPLLILLVGSVVLLAALAILLPILSLNQAVLQGG